LVLSATVVFKNCNTCSLSGIAILSFEILLFHNDERIQKYRGVVTAQLIYHWATSWMIGVLGFNSWQGFGIFLFTIVFRTALEPTQPPIQWVPGALSLQVKQLGHEADHSPLSSAKVKE
jgi:hypothetical protein